VPVDGVLLSLWRAAVVFRLVAAVLVGYLVIRWRNLYAEPDIAYAVGAAALAVTAVVAVVGVTGRAHRAVFVAADFGVCVVLTLLSRAAQHPSQFHGGMPTLTTVWAAGPVIEAGLVFGAAVGAATGVLQLVVSLIVRDGYDGRTLLNGLLLVLVGGLAGYLAALTVRAEKERVLIASEGARLAERERLTRAIHDGVLQVLGLVHRRGLAAGGEWAELGREAAAQEAALRAVINRAALAPSPAGTCNLAADLVELRAARVVVSVPDEPVLLAAARSAEVLDVVRAALHNVEQHAGSQASAWVFLELLPGKVAVTIRDDGVGMAAGRLDAAAAEGRLGVATSIKGRVADLGGTVTITSGPGDGTEVELVVPVDGDLR
jgi:signal transduction histidine kinase